MTPLQKHRAILYGRIGTSVVLFLAAMTIAAASALSANFGTHPFAVGGMLIGAVVLLPRRAVPTDKEVRQAADDEEIEFYKGVRQWLTWSRMAYLLVAIFVFFGLPYVV